MRGSMCHCRCRSRWAPPSITPTSRPSTRTRRPAEHEDRMTCFDDALHRVEGTPSLVVTMHGHGRTSIASRRRLGPSARQCLHAGQRRQPPPGRSHDKVVSPPSAPVAVTNDGPIAAPLCRRSPVRLRQLRVPCGRTGHFAALRRRSPAAVAWSVNRPRWTGPRWCSAMPLWSRCPEVRSRGCLRRSRGRQRSSH